MKAKHIFAILLVMVITVVSLAGCAEKKNMIPAEYKGLKFSVPEDWEREESFGLFYQATYDGGAKSFLRIDLIDFEVTDVLKEFSSWRLEAAEAALDSINPSHLRGYEAVSTEETQIDGQAALVHRYTRTGDRGTEKAAYYITGINTICIILDTYCDEADQTVEAEMKSDLDAFLKSIDLSGLE